MPTNLITRALVAVVLSLSITTGLAAGQSGLFKRVASALEGRPATVQVAATGTIEVGFSPNEGSEDLVIKALDSARHDIRLLAYSFTSPRVVGALLDARRRGVDIKVVADHKNNVDEDRSGKARAALSTLSTAGVEVRTVSKYPIHHDKVAVIDGQTVELGSFNYSDAAARKNSENVLVNWNNPALAKVYLQHFARNYNASEPYTPRY